MSLWGRVLGDRKSFQKACLYEIVLDFRDIIPYALEVSMMPS
jgi:hypothetical protein